jgi:hypothetical protein
MPTPFLGELLHGLALSVALGHRALLAVIERRRPAELRALAFGALDPFLAALADQAALELGMPPIVNISRPTSAVVSHQASPSDTKPHHCPSLGHCSQLGSGSPHGEFCPRWGLDTEVSDSANVVRFSSSNRRRADSVSSSGSSWLPGMEQLFDRLFRVLDPRAVLAIVLLCFELLQETETRRSGCMP